MVRRFSSFGVPQLHRLSPDEVGEVIKDLRLISEGAAIYFAVDPNEIAEFCFPIKPIESNKLPDIDNISDEQAAFYEIFYRRPQKPILLPEYDRELQGVLSYFERELGTVYDKAEMLQELIKAGGLNELLTEKKKEYESIAEEYFNILLAVARGVFSLGVERFREIFHQRLSIAKLETSNKDDETIIKGLIDSYDRRNLVGIIYNRLKDALTKDMDAVEMERRKRSLMVDARAIDRALYINEVMEESYRSGRLSQRYITLYLSSAHRTGRIFKLPEVQAALPLIDGERFNIWRTRRQIFVYVVHKSNSNDSREQITESIRNLEKVKRVLTELKKLERNISYQCEHCVLNDKGQSAKDCELESFCSEVRSVYEEIQRARLQVKNLGLVNTLDDFDRLVKTNKPSLKGAEHPFEAYLELFADVCRSGIRDVARDKMQQKQRWILLNSEVTNLFKEGFNIGKEASEVQDFRVSIDAVTGIDHILPTKPKLKSGKYNKILKLILDYYGNPSPSQFDSLEQAYKDYVKLDPGPGRREPEQELINCYLYLAFGKGKDERRAYEYARELVGLAEFATADLSMEQEYRYVLLWAARRQGQFEEADECARLAISRWPDDPRFYHGRCLNIYSWMTHEKVLGECPYTTWDAVRDAEKAIELYAKDRAKNKDVIATLYNTIAYLLAYEITRNRSTTTDAARQTLGAARENLEKLKSLVNKNRWIPDHPEFFHTEAFLEYQEFLTNFAAGVDMAKLQSKLENAKRDIDIATQIYKRGPRYEELQEQINKSLDDISAGRLGSVHPKPPEIT